MTARRSSRPTRWVTDHTMLCERLAERLRHEGYPHPGVAAVALAVRGARGADQAAFAAVLGVPRPVLAAAEAGELAFDRLPAALQDLARTLPRLDLDRLVGGPAARRPPLVG